MRLWLREARERQNMTQADVADLTGIARSAFSMIESGQRNPSVKVAQRIGKVLKIRWTVFFTQDNTNSVVGNAS